MRVANVMTTPVISVEPTTSIADAARLMLAQHISGLPVVAKDGTLVGMVTEGDFLRRAELGTQVKRSWWLELIASPGKEAEEYVHAHGRKVEEVMTCDVLTTTKDAPLSEIVETMTRARVKRLPVVENGKLVGIISRSDLLRALAAALPTASVVETDDARLRAAILSELARQPWSGSGLIRVHLENGVAELRGTIFDDRERMAARVCAENVPGVTSVVDQLVWVEPMSGMVILPPGADAAERGAA
ncbi:CBS domain-containing protein [Roseixanthobacter pseudopolyaromaticivorans]|uniref:CBS domain-containing protein n=1 Tax=Xanthobacteraceae TaxID=335928 RepID=UPI00372BD974